ncbi:MAG TPA: extracellular solute-binding protein [Candidatus Acidoferrales bacterium]|nr:extracellular solute-binding protein [Candidatus Acidoferrales bacterium]
MKLIFLAVGLATAWLFSRADPGLAAVAAAVVEAKKAAEAKGYIFETSHDEIVAKAKKEGRVRALTGLDPETFPHMLQSFKKKYPFIEVELVEIQGPDAAQRFIMELKARTAQKWDTANAATEFYEEYVSFAKKFDILGMAEHGVLGISPKMIDPKYRTTVSLTSGLTVPVYNRKLISEERVPDKWEDFLKPEFKGRKFMVDIRTHVFAAFPACPEQGLGLEWAMRLARGLREQDPVWFRGNSRAIRAIHAGEYPLHFGTHYQSIVRAIQKDPTGALQFKILEPVPLRLGNSEMVLNSAPHPYASLLLLEHFASPEGQEIIDKYYPAIASVFSPGSNLAKLLRGKKLCVNSFDTFHQSAKWMAMAVEAFGFPKAETGK